MPELAVIVPTLDDRSNVEPLLARLENALAGVSGKLSLWMTTRMMGRLLWFGGSAWQGQ